VTTGGTDVGTIAAARAALLAWYDRIARDLPWRRTRDPYAIWVSEVMLQQTRVDTVVPYFERFLTRFPTMQALAEATEDEVLSMWSGLGYYRRARFLRRGVAEALERYGEVPEDAAARRSLPGIGAYTAGAIGSIAFDRPEPIVDGNVARVLSRFHRLEGTLGESKAMAVLWSLASTWAQGERPGALNQGLMELGATVCVPIEPRCGDCPLASACGANTFGETAVLPRTAAKKKPKATTWSAALLRDADGRVGLVRGTAELFGGLYGWPTVHGDAAALDELVRALAPDATVDPEPAFAVKHVLSHRALTVSVHHARATRFEGDVMRLDAAALESVGVSRLTRKILERAESEGEASRPKRAMRGRARS